ncbi:hypothetical protein GCM10007276_01910 [Agaricicola taiwanensis]|uniref:HTH gntR-type domain-containing protein n=1 Tax=Agaricicola taiwanensis TaxID=591372 RepID=A0A8J2YBM0_9RHOB|nr:GntR family transcriptional regulator [Agaricicola taiwanensis]GGE28335.1 hypothetical protein GCM10007276_01910 [Agaricicola taiwanensis]
MRNKGTAGYVMSSDTQTAARSAPNPGSGGGARASLRDVAYEAIKRRIITCELRPGEVMSAAELSDHLDIGRTPVNQAIDRLMTDGLVEVMPRKGIVVKPISLDEVFDIIEVRLINEAYCVRRAAEHAGSGLIAALQENVAKMEEAVRDRDTEGMMELDRAFHAHLSQAAGNQTLSEILGNLHDRSARLWFISLKAREHHVSVCRQHAAVADAIARHDPDAAEAAIVDHIEAFRANITRQI